jgi:hypothetical protein
MQYEVTVQPLMRKPVDLGLCQISLDRRGSLLVLDADGIDVLFSAQRCRVDVMARAVVVISGYSTVPEYVEVFCAYVEGGK